MRRQPPSQQHQLVAPLPLTTSSQVAAARHWSPQPLWRRERCGQLFLSLPCLWLCLWLARRLSGAAAAVQGQAIAVLLQELWAAALPSGGATELQRPGKFGTPRLAAMTTRRRMMTGRRMRMAMMRKTGQLQLRATGTMPAPLLRSR